MFTQREFCLTDEVYKRIKDFANTHECKCKQGDRRSASCCGGEITVAFTPTTIGTLITAKCICGQEKAVDPNRY